ncbi:MAG: biosynthetic-type acetolactate synthase large subunit [Finegoldia sp.]|nr:biosynthetic-type acetolactate synthase large subunit [Finegoldia sp.]
MITNGASILLKSLEDEGVKRIFGYPGGSVLPIYDELLKSNIEHILMRNEQACAHAASGVSRSTGKVGVCLCTSGPGATNLVTGIATAFMDSVPLVAITGQVPSSMVGTDAFQEVDITGITLPIVKHSYLVKDANDIGQTVKDAFHIANTGRKGPVLIDIPRDVQLQEVDYKEPEKTNLPGYKPNYNPNKKQVSRVVKKLKESKRPMILLGGGVNHARAYEKVEKMVNLLKIPVITTLMGISSISRKSPYYCGMIGLHGSVAANYATSKCDFLLNLGARFDDRTTIVSETFASDATIVHVDIDPAEIGKNIETNIPVVADINVFLDEFIPKLSAQDWSGWMAEVKSMAEKYPTVNKGSQTVNPKKVFEKLAEKTDDNIFITTEVGQHQMFAAQYFPFKKPGSFITSGGLGTMGYGLPAAIGVAIENPDCLVVNICGDGSLQMNFAEIATAIEHDLPIKLILFNNNSLNLVRQLQYFANEARYSGIDFTKNPDFCKLVSAYEGTESYRITSEDQIDEVFDKALNNSKFTLIEIQADPNDIVYPVASPTKGIRSMSYLNKTIDY